MSNFVASPNLPISAAIIIIGGKYADILQKSLENIGVSLAFVPNNPNVDPRLCGHTDLSVFHAGGERVYLAPYLKGSAFAGKLTEIGAKIHFPEIEQSKLYPNDAQLNLALVGEKLIFGKNISWRAIVDYLTIACAFTPIAVRQGYVKCSTLIVDGRSIITQDRGIARAALCAGLNVLEISPGHVGLDGFEYGFLGGAGFKISEKTMVFTGVLDAHPDKQRILDFLACRGIRPVFLTEKPVFDIGSAIPLTEM